MEMYTSTGYSTHRCRVDPPSRINQFEWLREGCGAYQFERLGTNKGVVGAEGGEGIPEEL